MSCQVSFYSNCSVIKIGLFEASLPIRSKDKTNSQNAEKTPEKKSSGPCGFCGALAEVKCQSCMAMYYCDENCQNAHLEQHKTSCKQNTATTTVPKRRYIQIQTISDFCSQIFCWHAHDFFIWKLPKLF